MEIINNKLYMFWKLLLLAMAATIHVYAHAQTNDSCFFIFGDSSSDNGNNNALFTLAKYNYPPYGVDFPSGATGRATNGRTVPDFISELLGFNVYIPPYASARGQDILKGVNYASGAAGILPETGKQMGADISMDAQIANHVTTIVGTITAKLGSVEATKKYLKNCLHYVNIGSNDYINNYFMPQYYLSSHIYNLTQFTDLLISKFSRQLRELHLAGGRKFGLVNLGFIGCTPNARSTNNGECVQEIKTAASMFNERLKVLVDQLNSDFSNDSSVFTIVNSTAIFTLNSGFAGFKVQNASCCKTVSSTGLCVKNGTPCENRNEYIFWDGFHTTEAANAIFALSAYNASNPNYTYPFNMSRLLSS